jgi:alkylation response protein AidB-like acyl-CoA dehydrogenase
MSTEQILRDGVRRWLRTAEPANGPLPHEGLVSELGLSGLLVPEQLGGAGGSLDDALVVQEELGRALATTTFLRSSVLAVTALVAADTQSARAVLTEVAGGKLTAELLIPASWRADDPAAQGATRDCPSDWVIEAVGSRGAVSLVGRRRHDPIAARPVVLAEAGTPALARAMDAGRIALAAELNGSAARALDLVTEYGVVRETFGRAIGSYQAFRHACAEHWITLQLNQALVRSAAASWARDDQETTGLAAAAGASAAEGARAMAEACVLLHGAIGFTWEHEAHRHLRRAVEAVAFLRGTTTQWELSLPA